MQGAHAYGVNLYMSNVSSSSLDHGLDATSPSSVSHERGGDPSVSYLNSPAYLLEKEKRGSHQLEKNVMWGEPSSIVVHEHARSQKSNDSSVLANRVQSQGLKLGFFDEKEKYIHTEQNLEIPASQITFTLNAIGNEGGVSVESENISLYKENADDQENCVFEDNLKGTSEPTVYFSTTSEVINQYFDSEESQDVGLNLSHESNEGASLEKKMKMASSLQEISLNDEELYLELGKIYNETGIEHCSSMECHHVKDGSQEIIVDAQNEGLSSLKEHIMLGSSIRGKFEQGGLLMKGSTAIEIECVKRHLYLSYIDKDILQLYLAKQTQLNEDFHQHSSHETHRLIELVKKTQESEEMVTEELVQCKLELQFLSPIKDEIEIDCLSARKQVEHEHIKCCNSNCELGKSQEDLLHVSNDLEICRGIVDALQKNNSKLLANLFAETDGRKKFVEEVEFLSSEPMNLTAALMEETNANMKIAEERQLLFSENVILLSELTAKEERLQIALEKNIKLLDNLRELDSCSEQLVEENFYLSINLNIYISKIKEMERWIMETHFSGRECHIDNKDLINGIVDLSLPFYEASVVNTSSSIKLKSNFLFQDHGSSKYFDSYALFKVLKECLQEAKTKLQDLEKSAQVMHSHSLSLSGSGGVLTTAGVSKLIKAFESKAHHVDDSGEEELPLIVGERPEGSYALWRKHALSLSNIVNRMEFELGKAEIHVMDSQLNGETLKKCKMDYETQKHKNSTLQVAFDELVKKMIDYESRVYEFPSHIDELHQHVNKEAAGFLDKVELLKREVIENASIFKKESDSIEGMILEAVGLLDSSTGLKVLEDLDTRSHLFASVNAALLTIENLHGKLEESNHNYNKIHDSREELNKSFMNIQGMHVHAIELFYKFYNNLMEVINEGQQDNGNAAINFNIEKMVELPPEKYEMVVSYLQELLSERDYLLSRNAELDMDLSIKNQEIDELNGQFKELEIRSNIIKGLESTLLNKTMEIEEVKRRCVLLVNQLEDHDSCKDLYSHARSRESDVTPSKDANDVVSCNSLLSQLDQLVSFHLLNYEELLEQLMLSRKHLQDANILMEVSVDDCFLPLPTMLGGVFIPKVIELHEKLKLLTVSNVGKETEIQVLKEGIQKVEETLDSSRHELQWKASEVEHLEQKLFSVREKLSIAVAKGKGLIVQRDSLKQSLMEKTSELEKSTQELLLKEALLDELEGKLKSCSEVERIEALEFELSYIRNSATAMRDSFLQKDSVLQRIEEALEDLELSDDFHDKDILEKIELLSRFVIDHSSSTVTEFQRKSSVELGLDFDELKRKYEELQGKFYGLAEHNDMLEQSLLERTNLVQKWEYILERISLPSHMQTMEPEDKIECLGRELWKVNQERDSLQVKIDNLEISYDMVISDIEESHKKISELTAEVLAVKSEKEFFSENFEKLRFEYYALAEKAAFHEQDRDTLHKKLDDLQDKLIDNTQFEEYKDIENYLQKLIDLVDSALKESDKVDFYSDDSLAEHLETSFKKLIDNYNTLLNKYSNMFPVNEALLNEGCSGHGKMVPGEISTVDGKIVLEEIVQGEETGTSSISLELDRTSDKLASVEQDRNAIIAKCQSLMLEIEDLKMQVNMLNAQKNEDLEKYQSLLLELNAIGKQRDSLREQITQEEQKTASIKEKLNLAVRKGKGLVQQRDSLKLTIDEMNALMEQLKIDNNQQMETLMSENTLLMSRLADMEMKLQDSQQNYSRLLAALHAVDLDSGDDVNDPVQKLVLIGSMLLNACSSAAAAEHEANKSKRAAELLLSELNEVQERNDVLQDELTKAEASLVECSKQKNDSLSRFEHILSVHFEERSKLAKNLENFLSVINQLRQDLLLSSRTLSDAVNKHVDLFRFVEDLREFMLDKACSSDGDNQPLLSSRNILSPMDSKNEIPWPISDIGCFEMHQHLDETLLFKQFALADQALCECTIHCNELKENICEHSVLLDKKMVFLSETMDAVKRKTFYLKDTSESLKRDFTHLESKLKEKDAKIDSIYRNLTMLYEACSTSVMETLRRKSQITGNNGTLGEDYGHLGIILTLPSYSNLEEDEDLHSINDYIKMMAKTILSTMKDTNSTDELAERTTRELKATVLALQRELQEKDVQMNRVCEELVSQIKDAETVAKRSMVELDSSRAQLFYLEKKAEAMEIDRNSMELKLNALQDVEALSKLLQERIGSLTETVNAKDQEIEALMQALDEEETQMEALESRNKGLEVLTQKRTIQLETLETSHAKAMTKLSTTVSKFDELHNLSESLLLEVENLQTQLHERDSEISFLRQEITKCTNDVLASQENKKYSLEIYELLTWMNAMISHLGGPPVQFDDQGASQIHLYIDIMGKKIAMAVTDLEELRATVQCKDALLETERGRVEELLSRTKDLESALRVKGRFTHSHGGRSSKQQCSSSSSGTLEIEQMLQRNKVTSGPIATFVRGGRKANNDQIAIAIDSEKDDSLVEDEDDDKSHGFKPLIMSRLVPRATRPLADRIDGIWVSAERLLMRQPTLRLAFFMYWLTLHALLVSFI